MDSFLFALIPRVKRFSSIEGTSRKKIRLDLRVREKRFENYFG